MRATEKLENVRVDGYTFVGYVNEKEISVWRSWSVWATERVENVRVDE